MLFPGSSPRPEYLKAMRKLMVMAAAMALSAGAAGAQSSQVWKIDSCYHTAEDGVLCELIYTPKQDENYRYWRPSAFQATGPTGAVVGAQWIMLGEGEWNSSWSKPSTFYKGVGVDIAIIFNLPKSMTSFKVLNVDGYQFKNVPIYKSSSAVSSNSSQTVSLPSAQIIIGGKAYTIKFTKCNTEASGAYSCASQLTPMR